MIRLPKRLERIVDMVPLCRTAADIGCDHAYVSIALRERGKAERVLACDVRPGPLQQARANIARAGLADSIETRLGDGLQPVHTGEAETVILAGMGGELILRILEGRENDFSRFVLSPQSDIARVREQLLQKGLQLTDEVMLQDEGKFYVILSLCQGGSGPFGLSGALAALEDSGVASLPEEVLYTYGWLLLSRRDPVLRDFLAREKQRYEGILEKTEKEEVRRAYAHCCRAMEVYA